MGSCMRCLWGILGGIRGSGGERRGWRKKKEERETSHGGTKTRRIRSDAGSWLRRRDGERMVGGLEGSELPRPLEFGKLNQTDRGWVGGAAENRDLRAVQGYYVMKPKKLALLYAVVVAMPITAGHASDAPPENNTSTSPPRVSPAEEEAAARAFADARANTPVEWWNLEPFPWPRIATDARTAARRLAEAHREAMVSVLKKRLGRGTFSFHLLTLMILEELRMPHKAVELAVSSFKRANTVDVLAVSHCSQSVREGVANALLTKCLDEPGFPRRWGGPLLCRVRGGGWQCRNGRTPEETYSKDHGGGGRKGDSAATATRTEYPARSPGRSASEFSQTSRGPD